MRDENELALLARKVLLQAIGDYIRLQHPAARKKTSQMSSFLSAGDLLFDDEYRMAHFETGEGEDMNLTQFVSLALEDENPNLDSLREYIRQESINYWNSRGLKPMKIPEVVIIHSQPWHIFYAVGTAKYWVDFEKHSIFISKNLDVEEQSKVFLMALVDIMFDSLAIRSSGAKRKEFAEMWFEILTMNNEFKS